MRTTLPKSPKADCRDVLRTLGNGLETSTTSNMTFTLIEHLPPCMSKCLLWQVSHQNTSAVANRSFWTLQNSGFKTFQRLAEEPPKLTSCAPCLSPVRTMASERSLLFQRKLQTPPVNVVMIVHVVLCLLSYCACSICRGMAWRHAVKRKLDSAACSPCSTNFTMSSC